MDKNQAIGFVLMAALLMVYFMFFVLLFFMSPGGKTKPVPDRVTH